MSGENNVFDKIIRVYNTLTRSEMKVADYILNHKAELPFIMSKNLADACRVSEATITRFCHSVACRSFNDFKLRAAQAVSAGSGNESSPDYDIYGELKPGDSLEQKAQKLYHIGTRALQQTLEKLDFQSISDAVDSLLRADNVYCFGQGNTSIIAMDAWGRFVSVTPKFHWISNYHMQVMTAAALSENDVVLYFSYSGSMQELPNLGKIIHKSKAKLILVTRFPNSPGVKYADQLLICGANEAPNQQGSVAVKLGQLFIIDVLFQEYCARNPDGTQKIKARTLEAVAPLLL